MNSPTTDKEALEQCLVLWEYLRDNPEISKAVAVSRVLRYEPENDCPACERANCDCTMCPVQEWEERAEEDGLWYACEKDIDSPYRLWDRADDLQDFEDMAKYAQMMVDLIEKNLEAYYP